MEAEALADFTSTSNFAKQGDWDFNDGKLTGSDPKELTVTYTNSEFTNATTKEEWKTGKPYTVYITNNGANLKEETEETGYAPGIYDESMNLVCSWEESGMVVDEDFDQCSQDPKSPYYILTNKYPTVKNLILPDGITRIGHRAFDLLQLTSVSIPNTVVELGSYCFHASTIQSITLPDSLTSIGYRSFLDVPHYLYYYSF